MRHFLPYILLIALVTVSATASQTDTDRITITVNRASLVPEETVTLGDISKIENSTDDESRILKAIPIEKAPPIGRTKFITKEVLLAKLDRSGFDASSINLISPNKICIERDTQTISREQLKQIITQALLSKIPYPADRIVLTDFRLNEKVVVPKGKRLDFETLAQTRRRANGPVQVKININVDGKMVKQVFARVNVDVKVDMIRMTTSIARNETITSDMVEIVEGTLSIAPRDFMTDINSAIGKNASRSLKPGDVLTSRMVSKPMLVKSNSSVLIIAEKGALRITAIGQAKQNGAKGDIICVVNTASNKTLYAEVVDKNTVRVTF